MTIPTLLKPRDVADLLGVTEQTLAVWRCENRYPLPYVKAGRLVRYLEVDVIEFIKGRTHHGC